MVVTSRTSNMENIKQRPIFADSDDPVGIITNSPAKHVLSIEVVSRSNETLQVTGSATKPFKSSNRSKPGTKEQVVKEEPAKNNEFIEVPVRNGLTGRRRRSSEAQVLSVPSDPVIEQWYADPYNRYDPEGPADRELRRQNLTTALRNRGFRGGRIVNVVNWLIRCKGQHKHYNDLIGRHFRQKARSRIATRARTSVGTGHKASTPQNGNPKEQARHTPVTPSADTRNTICDKSIIEEEPTLDCPNSYGSGYPSPTSNSYDFDHGDLDTLHENCDYDNESNDQASSLPLDLEPEMIKHDLNSALEIADDFDVDDNDSAIEPSEPLTEHEIAALKQLQSSLQPTRPTFSSVHKPGTQAYKDDYDDWYLEALKRTQEFWNMIYGDDLDDGTPFPSHSKARHQTEEVMVKHEKEDDTSDNFGNVNDNIDEDEEKAGVKFTWFREPGGMPTVDVCYRTQGLKPLKKVMYKGMEVLTEDQTFGLCASRKA